MRCSAPPAAQSDIISVIDELSPSGILLIDGVFTQQLSVWHKEILYAMERGVAVYGSSSMGALRVAETAAFGARGFGQIYQAYASGEVDRRRRGGRHACRRGGGVPGAQRCHGQHPADPASAPSTPA